MFILNIDLYLYIIFVDPDTFEDGIYSGILIPPSGSLSSGTYSVGIEVLSEKSSWLIASGKKSISADQSENKSSFQSTLSKKFRMMKIRCCISKHL